LLPEVEPYLKIKFPTADEDRGLGTGEFDETIGVDLSKQLLERMSGFLTLAYTFIGDPPGTNLRDSFAGSIGAAYAVAASVQPLRLPRRRDRDRAGQDDPVELRVGAEVRLAKF